MSRKCVTFAVGKPGKALESSSSTSCGHEKRCIYSLERTHQVTLTKKITSMNDTANIQELILIQKYIMLININK
jgi:hypothetical protein